MWEHYKWVVKVVLSAAIENIVRRALNADNPPMDAWQPCIGHVSRIDTKSITYRGLASSVIGIKHS
jgi:hypothetical protein